MIKSNHKARLLLLGIFFLALLVRLAAVYLVEGMDGVYSRDGRVYNDIAYNLITGKGFTVDGTQQIGSRAPLWPFILAFIYKLFGYNYAVARIFQLIIGSLSCMLGWWIGKEVFSKEVGLLAALIMAVHPYLALLNVYLLTETLFTFLLMLSVLFFVKLSKQHKLSFSIIGGVCLGLAILSRSLILPLPVLLLLWIWPNFKDKREGLKFFFIIIIFTSLVISPWTIRNYMVYRRFIPVTTQNASGTSLWAGNNPQVYRLRDKRGTCYIPSSIRLKDESEYSSVERGLIYRDMAMKFIRENPRKVLVLSYYKFLRFWQWGYSTTFRNTLTTYVYGLFFFPFMLMGFFLSLKHSRVSWIIHLLCLLFSAVAIIFYGSDGYSGTRYRVPLEPYLSIFAAYGLVSLIKRYWPEARLLKLLER